MKRIALLLTILFIVGLGGAYLLFSFLAKPEVIQNKIIQYLEDTTDGTFSHNAFHLTYFPVPGVVFEGATLDGIAQQGIRLEAKELKLKLSLLSLIVGKAEAASLTVWDGTALIPNPYEVALPEIEVGNLNLKIKSLKSGQPIQLEFDGDLGGIPKVFSGEFFFTVEELGKWDWEQLDLEGYIKLRQLHLIEWVGQMNMELPIEITQGEFTSNINIKKEPGQEWLNATSEFELMDFVYQVRSEGSLLTSSEIQADLTVGVAWNPTAEELRIEESRLESPIGVMELSGDLFLGTGQIQDLRLTTNGVILDSIPQYWIPLKEAIPFNIGFSGPADMEATFEGRWDHLSMHASIDLKRAILTYARVFSKPKELPLNVTMDFLLKEHKTLSGDFSIKFQDANVKGTLTDVDVKKNQGQINLITNKFQLAGWESLLPMLENYRIQGELKVLANWNGELSDMRKAMTMMNVTLDNGYLARSDSASLRIPHIAVDYGSMALVLKDFEAVIADAPVRIKGFIYNIYDNPFAQIKVQSDRIEPSKVIAHAEDWLSEWGISSDVSPYREIKYWVSHYFPPDEALGNLTADLEYKKQNWLIENIRFDAYAGSTQMQGEIDLETERASYGLNLEVNKVNMAEFLTRGSHNEASLEGNLFVDMRFEGETSKDQNWFEDVQGEGTLMMTNGAFAKFDLLRAVGNINELSEVGRYASGNTPFDDVHAHFYLRNNKLLTDKMMLLSPDLTVEANGETSLDGTVNYRLDIFLSPFFTEEYIGPILGGADTVQGKQFGPVPMLLAGSLDRPNLQPDPELVPQLVDRLLRRKHHKVLRNFLPEDLFFEPRSSS